MSNTKTAPALNIVKIRGRFFVAAGVSKLSKGFKTVEAAVTDRDENSGFYEYWAGSASVSVENTKAVIIVAG